MGWSRTIWQRWAGARFIPGAMGLSLCSGLWSSPVSGQATTDAIPRGVILEQVVSPSNPEESYGLYLPTDYDAAAPPPAVIIMGGGGALLAMERMVPGAESVGYMMVASSRAAPGQVEVSREVLNTVLQDLSTTIRGDVGNIVLLGFSGTARMSWAFGYEAMPSVMGIIGLGAGLFEGMDLEALLAQYGEPYTYFGGAGYVDYNMDELVQLEDQLAATGIPNRFRYYPGPHTWPQEPVFREAIEWTHLQAQQRGRLPVDGPWIQAFLARQTAAADSILAEGRAWEAWARYRDIVEDFDGVSGLGPARSRLATLEADPRVVLETARRRDVANVFMESKWATSRWLLAMREAPEVPSLERSIEGLDIAALIQTRNSDNPTTSQEAERKLAYIGVMTGYYEALRYLELDEPARALAVLEIANYLRPDQTGACLYQAQAMSRLQRYGVEDRARCFLRGGGSWNAIQFLPDFEWFRGTDAYVSLQREFGGG